MVSRMRKSVAYLGGLVIATALAAPLLAADTKPQWPQDTSDLKADSRALFGVLPNGMHYIVMHNASPPGQAAVRMRIGSGSAEETDAQQGLAHLLEHMSFKGSKHVQEGEMIKILERKGLAFGADTNAQTGFLATTFILDVPETKGDTLDTALMLMRETAGELTLTQKALDPERGVVLSEERLRDTPQYRASTATMAFAMQGQLYPKRFPIGKDDVIKNASAGLLREYYEANYRPDRTTLIVVGDFDANAIVGKIKARFSDWQPVGPGVKEPDFGKVLERGMAAKVIDLPGSGTQIQLMWEKPFDTSGDSLAKQITQLNELMGLAILNTRLGTIATSKDPSFNTANAMVQNADSTAKVSEIDITATPSTWQGALASVTAEQRRIVQYGVSQIDLDRALAKVEVQLKSALDTDSTKASSKIASDMLDGVESNTVFTSAADDLKLFEEHRAQFNVASVNAALKSVFSGSGPLVIMSTPPETGVSDAILTAEYQKDIATPLTATAATAALAWPYTTFGTPEQAVGKVVKQTTIDDLGFSEIEFANHVRLNVKTTDFRKDEILVNVDIGHGLRDLPTDRPSPTWASSAFLGGGLTKLGVDDIGNIMSNKVARAQFSIDSRSFRLSGATRPQDFAFQMQLLAAYLVDPAYRAEAFVRTQKSLLNSFPQMAATPQGVMSLEAGGFLHGHDPRWQFPTADQVAAAKPDDLRAMLQKPLANGAIEITIIGDISVDQAIAQVAATFGALPARADAAVPMGATNVHLPAPNSTPVVFTHNGRPDQTLALEAWPTEDIFANVQQNRALMLAQDIMQSRLLDELRIKNGATYSPQGTAQFSQSIPGFGFVYESVETKPENSASVFSSISKITSDLGKTGVTADELLRAKAPSLEQRKHYLTNNQYWITALSGIQAEPRELDIIRTLSTGMELINATDVQNAAAKYLTDAHAIKVQIEAAKYARKDTQ